MLLAAFRPKAILERGDLRRSARIGRQVSRRTIPPPSPPCLLQPSPPQAQRAVIPQPSPAGWEIEPRNPAAYKAAITVITNWFQTLFAEFSMLKSWRHWIGNRQYCLLLVGSRSSVSPVPCLGDPPSAGSVLECAQPSGAFTDRRPFTINLEQFCVGGPFSLPEGVVMDLRSPSAMKGPCPCRPGALTGRCERPGASMVSLPQGIFTVAGWNEANTRNLL